MSGPIKAKSMAKKPAPAGSKTAITLKIKKNASHDIGIKDAGTSPAGNLPTGILQPLASEVAQEIRKAEKAQDIEAKRNKFIVQVEDPYAPRKLKQSRILNEEDYVEALSSIIERDFYPDLPSLRYKHAIMEAQNAGDEQLVDELSRKLDALARPTPVTQAGGTPVHRPGETPGRSPGTSPGRSPGPSPGSTPVHESDATPARSEVASRTPIGKLASALSGQGAAPSSSKPGPGTAFSEWERDDDVEVASTVVTEDLDAKLRNALLRQTNGKAVQVDLSNVRLDDFQATFTSEDNESFEKLLEVDNDKKRAEQWWIEEKEAKYNTQLLMSQAAIEDGEAAGAAVKGGALLSTKHKARDSLFFYQKTIGHKATVKPVVEFKNTRFTTDSYNDLENQVDEVIRQRKEAALAQKFGDKYLEMAKNGEFGGVGDGDNAPTNKGFGLVSTPVMLPGDGGKSPIMTFGQIASTPVSLEEQPAFKMQPESEREKARDKLNTHTTLLKRDHKKETQHDRLRSLGLVEESKTPGEKLAPKKAKTPIGEKWAEKATAGGVASRAAPGTALVSSGISPLSPIGALIKRAQRMTRQGGVLGIKSTPTGTPVSSRGTPSGITPRTTPGATPGRSPGSTAGRTPTGGTPVSTRGGSTPTASQARPRPSGGEPPAKRQKGTVPESMLEDLM